MSDLRKVLDGDVKLKGLDGEVVEKYGHDLCNVDICTLDTDLEIEGYRLAILPIHKRADIEILEVDDEIIATDKVTGAFLKCELTTSLGLDYKIKKMSQDVDSIKVKGRGKGYEVVPSKKYDSEREPDLKLVYAQIKECSEFDKRPKFQDFVDLKKIKFLVPALADELRRYNDLPLASEEEEKNDN